MPFVLLVEGVSADAASADDRRVAPTCSQPTRETFRRRLPSV